MTFLASTCEKPGMEIAVGTYEEILLGYRLVEVTKDNDYQLEQSFSDHTHTACIKTIAVSRKGVLASGGSDETIQLYNLRNRRQLGCLHQHSGSITCLDFFKHTHMFSCSEDGTLCIWKAFTWECLKTLKGHQGAVNHLAVHPSGKLALTVGKDKTLRTWNLITGRSAYITNIKKVADMVFWSPDGQYYVTTFPNSIDVYTMETAAVHVSWTTEKRINNLVFLNNEVVAYGGDDGIVFFHNIKDNKVLGFLDTDTNRIRGMTVTPDVLNEINTEKSCLLCTASSDGFIKVYSIEVTQDEVKQKLLASTNTEFRLTSIAVALHKPKNEKKEHTDNVKSDTEFTSTESAEEEENNEEINSETEEIVIVQQKTDKLGNVGEIDRAGESSRKKVKKSMKGKRKKSTSDTTSQIFDETPKRLKKDKSKVVSFEDSLPVAENGSSKKEHSKKKKKIKT